MVKRIRTYLERNWRDIGAFCSVVILAIASYVEDYHLGMLVGLLVMFVFFSFERIKRVIVELNIKRIFGVEFGELEREAIKTSIRASLATKGASLPEDTVNAIADYALNSIEGVANKGRYYEELVKYALDDMGVPFTQNMQGAVGKQMFDVDFLSELESGATVAIEAIYSEQRFIPTDRLRRIREQANTLSKVENLAGFIVVTNTGVRPSDTEMLKESSVHIEVIENTISPGGILSRLQACISDLKHAEK